MNMIVISMMHTTCLTKLYYDYMNQLCDGWAWFLLHIQICYDDLTWCWADPALWALMRVKLLWLTPFHRIQTFRCEMGQMNSGMSMGLVTYQIWEWNHVSYVKDMSHHGVWRADKKEEEPQKHMVLWTTSTVQGDNLVPRVSCWYGIMDLWGRVVICIRCGWAMGLWWSLCWWVLTGHTGRVGNIMYESCLWGEVICTSARM